MSFVIKSTMLIVRQSVCLSVIVLVNVVVAVVVVVLLLLLLIRITIRAVLMSVTFTPSQPRGKMDYVFTSKMATIYPSVSHYNFFLSGNVSHLLI